MKRRRRAHPVHIVDVVRGLVGAQEGVWRRRSGSSTQTFEVFEAFSRLGAPLTEQAEPVGYRRGVLTLAVQRSAWLTELSMLSERIVARLNKELGSDKVKSLRLRPGAMTPKPPPIRAPKLTRRQAAVVQEALTPIDDPKLREAFERAAQRSLTRTRRGKPAEGPPGPRVCPPTPPPAEEEEPGLRYGYGEGGRDRWADQKKDRWKK